MTTSPIVTITNELLAELEAATEYQHCDMPGAAIRALLAERADLKQQLAAAAITAENCELFRKDAERYDWLREMHNDEYGCLWVSRWNYDRTEWVSLDAFCRSDYNGELDLDAAIDAAREADQ